MLVSQNILTDGNIVCVGNLPAARMSMLFTDYGGMVAKKWLIAQPPHSIIAS